MQQEADIKGVAKAVSVLLFQQCGDEGYPGVVGAQKTGIPTPKNGEEVLVPVAQSLPVQAGLSQLRERMNVAALSQRGQRGGRPGHRTPSTGQSFGRGHRAGDERTGGPTGAGHTGRPGCRRGYERTGGSVAGAAG
ncbi:hypothetical protein O5699_25775 [Escherichia coli]|nr:hypothetical protein [Escherichia coli]